MRLVQLTGPGGRRVARVEEPKLRLLDTCASIYDLASECLANGVSLAQAIDERASVEVLDYNAIYAGESAWRLRPSADFPAEPARCLVSGTGLTHQASAQNRDAMHAVAQAVTDSTRMYRSGVQGGKPAPGETGVAPEWFYKGSGLGLRAHNEPLVVPEYAEDGGEEPEVAGVYLIDVAGRPRRIGFTVGNEFSDHVFERKNYLYLAASKLRTCAIGPELVIGGGFDQVPGDVSVGRAGQTLWSRTIQTGERTMCHSLANIEHHHFKFEFHRHPGDLHIHFFGADAFSFGDGVRLQEGDVMQVRFEGFGRALRNPLLRVPGPSKLFAVEPI
ncbi:MAG TPA: AraD1 family protein [Candidatus Dormibacteraeota bacterium]|nr:AraD1 family protein [Candidatus Dormibacteraeota bacterium]